MRAARERGIKGFRAVVIAGNTGMLKVFQKSGCRLHTDYDGGEVYLSFLFDEKTDLRKETISQVTEKQNGSSD